METSGVLPEIGKIKFWHGWYHVGYHAVNTHEIQCWAQEVFRDDCTKTTYMWSAPAQNLPGTFQFRHEKDALLFLLRWGV